MLHQILLVVQLLLVVAYADHQTYPGTATRPVLSDAEAASYTKAAYLQGWTPETIKTTKADYVVGSGGYSTIQAAVNAAIKAGGTTRKYIKISDGTYRQAVMIPKTTVPLTLYGNINNPEAVHIILSQGANLSGADYAKQVNPNNANYKEGDPAWSMYNNCATRATIGTSCSGIVQANSDDLEVAYITIENTSIDGQAVAAKTSGDKQNWDHVHFYGFQDTLEAGGKRIYFNKPTIKGDVDFIFGDASAVFESAQIIARADRPRTSALIFAPNTDNSQKYGYLVINSKITADNAIKGVKGASLARAWDSSSSSAANGQLVIRETEIVDVINESAPYSTATSGRKYAGNINKNRNLDDANYNRFWEYKNTGDDANGQVVIRETEIVDVIKVDAPYSTAAGGRPYAGNANTNRNLDNASYNRFWEYKNTGDDPSANGQVVIRETEIDDVIKVNAPYATAAGGRPYSGNIKTDRNMDDANYNRFWEYKNTGAGA